MYGAVFRASPIISKDIFVLVYVDSNAQTCLYTFCRTSIHKTKDYVSFIDLLCFFSKLVFVSN